MPHPTATEPALIRSQPPENWSRLYGHVHWRTLFIIRWIAICGQAAALWGVYFILGYEFRFDLALAILGLSILVNILAFVRRPAVRWLSDREAALFLAFDLLQLTALLYLTGGLQNPFALLILAPVTVSATILSRRSTVALSLIALGSVLFLAVHFMPLPWPGVSPHFDPLYRAGIGLALALAITFSAAYIFQVAEEARRLAQALGVTQRALDRERHVFALGAQAAAAAHELGSPLGTITLVAKELLQELSPDDPLYRDAELLVSESKRCSTILQELALRSREDSLSSFLRVPLPALIEEAARPHRQSDVQFDLRYDPKAGKQLAAVTHRPEILHGLGNFLQNAIQFAQSTVTVWVEIQGEKVSLRIEDDGPGFDPQILDRLGEPYLSEDGGRAGDHMGLGIFIAKTLLEHTGATLRFYNHANGAGVAITWQISNLCEA